VAASAQGIGFAVPIDAAAAVIAEARASTDAT
jgi:S1-C subfamily serine protease